MLPNLKLFVFGFVITLGPRCCNFYWPQHHPSSGGRSPLFFNLKNKQK